jgi:hypothetical protein
MKSMISYSPEETCKGYEKSEITQYPFPMVGGGYGQREKKDRWIEKYEHILKLFVIII